MPWFGIPEFLKKRACRYLLQHYLGQFLEEKISLEDLTVDLYNGTGSIHNIPLNVEAINESLKWVGAPVQVLAGFIECVTVSVPWAALLKDNCKVELAGLTLTVAPHARLKMEEFMSMTDSLFFSMTSSRQMAEEVLREGQGAGDGGEATAGFEGMETLARAIELVLARVQVSLKDTVIQVNYDSGSVQTHNIKHFLRFRIKGIEFYDEVSQVESSVDSPDVEAPPPPMDYAVKLLHLLDLSAELGSSSAVSTESSLSDDDMESVPIAVAGGKLTVTVTIKQSDQVPGPKLNVEGFLGSLHVLLSPQQLGSLLQLVKEVAAQTSSSRQQRNRLEKLSPGQSRPIPRVERSALESQLAQHQHQEREARSRLHRKQRDLLTSDPWDDLLPPRGEVGTSADPFIPMTASASNEQFYSLDLNSSYSSSTIADSMSESRLGDDWSNQQQELGLRTQPFRSDEEQVAAAAQQGGRGILHRYHLEANDVHLHEGLGLQQFSGTSAAAHDPFDPPKATTSAYNNRPSSKPRPSSLDKESRHSCSESRLNSISKYSLTLNGATLALLEANPAHTYSTKVGGNQSSSLSSVVEEKSQDSPPTSMDEGGLDPVRYFELVSQWLSKGVNWHSYQQHQKQLAQFLPVDHLLVWLSVLRGNVDLEEDQGDYEVTLAGAEVWEHLYHNHTPHINLITRPISICPILQLQGDLQHTPPKPCLKLKVHSCPDTSHKRRQHNQVSTLAEVDMALSIVHLNIDPTLMDRLQLLLAAPPDSAALQYSSMDKVKQSLYMTSSNAHTIQQQRQLVFHQAVQPGYSSSHSSTTLKVKVNGDKLHLSLRFPVPQINKAQQPPWFRPSLRTEVLYADVAEWQVSSQLHPLALAGDASYSIEAQFQSGHAFLSTSGAQVDRELFLVVSSKSSGASSPTTNSMEAVSISIEVQPEPDRTLEQHQDKQGQEVPYMLDLLEQSCYEDSSKKQPLPFSNKRSMFSARHQGEFRGDEDSNDIHSEERVLPGSISEMTDFEAHASNTARYLITAQLPEVRLHLPSKHFLETLYNRFCVDLAVWKPASVAAVSKANAQSVLYSCMDLLQPAVTNEERFLMCKSALKEEDSDDDDDDDDDDFKTRMDALGYSHDSGSKELSSLALSLSIDEGVVSLLPEMLETGSGDDSKADLFQSALERDLIDISSENKEESPPTDGDRRCGMAVLDLSGFHGFYVLGYKGDDNHHYACGWIQDSTLYHHGNPGCVPDRCCSVSTAFDLSVYDHLLPILSSRSVEDQPMVGVAMEVQAEKEHSTQTRKVAVALSNTSFFYHVTPSSLGLQQLGAFLDMKEEEVEGLEMPALVTELHVHIANCNLEYRPLYLPIVSTFVLDSMSLSTSIVAGAPVHVLRLVIDGAYLLLTATKTPPNSSPYSSSSLHSSSLSSSSICVMEMEWLELTLRHCNTAMLDKEVQKLLCDMSDLSVECSSNVVHFRMCVDSCIALRDLLTYLSARRDLQPRPSDKEGKGTSWDYFTVPLPSVAATATSAAPTDLESSSPSSNSTPPLSRHLSKDQVENGEIGDLISDAMEDASPTITRSMMGPEESKGDKDFVVPSSKIMEVQGTGDSLVMDFDSDSDDEGFAASRLGTGRSADLSGHVLQTRADGGRRRIGSSDTGNLFIDAEDDFCIVDTPTFTRVAPGSKPVVRCLLEDGEHIEVVQDHFSIPDGRVNYLRRPSSFPLPQIQYTLKEMTIVWHLYGGKDFAPVASRKQPHRETGRKAVGMMGGASWRQPKSQLRGRYGLDLHGRPWKLGGGPGRDHSVLVEVELDKLRIQHETYPPTCEQACRVVVLIGEVDVRDKLANSEINKLLYQYTTEAMPRQSHASMVSVKVLYTRPELDAHQEEASVYVSVLPIRLNLDQDTVLFLYNFIQQAGDNMHLSTIFESGSENKSHPVSKALVESGSAAPESTKSGSSVSHPVTTDSHIPTSQCENSTDSRTQQVFIRSFKFHPDLPIRIDYEAKGFKTEIGTIAGILLGLSHLNTAEVTLKALHYKKGLLGWDKVLEYSTDEWLRDITSYQLPLLFKGVGPLNSFSQLVSGLFKFVQLPCQQYQEDGRVMFGLQRGASALTSSTGVAVVELTSQLLEAVQALAQMAYDLVAPGEQVPRPLPGHHHKSHQPVDFREGFSNAYDVVSTGIGDTASNLITVASKEHQERGTASAVGTVLRHVPGALVQPIILASEATRHVLGGVKNQFVPDARTEAHKKWKALDTSDEPK